MADLVLFLQMMSQNNRRNANMQIGSFESIIIKFGDLVAQKPQFQGNFGINLRHLSLHKIHKYGSIVLKCLRKYIDVVADVLNYSLVKHN